MCRRLLWRDTFPVEAVLSQLIEGALAQVSQADFGTLLAGLVAATRGPGTVQAQGVGGDVGAGGVEVSQCGLGEVVVVADQGDLQRNLVEEVARGVRQGSCRLECATCVRAIADGG